MLVAWSTISALGVVIPALIGLVVGFMSNSGLFSESVRLGATVDYARYYADHPERFREISPGFPRGIVFAESFTLYGLLRGWCSGCLLKHQFFGLSLFAGVISSAAWLLLNYRRQSSIDAERHARIDQFMSDPNAEAPPPVPDVPPQWFRVWHAANVTLFFALLAPPVIVLLTGMSASIKGFDRS
jgi:hypothetical protein